MPKRDVKVAIIGGGVSGLMLSIELQKRLGLDGSVTVSVNRRLFHPHYLVPLDR